MHLWEWWNYWMWGDMDMLDYKILGSGSNGNCLIFNKYMAIDMGIPYRQIKPYLKELKVVLLTHIHSWPL